MARILLNKTRPAPREGNRDILRKSREIQRRRFRRLMIFWGIVFALVMGLLIFLIHQRFVLVQNIVVKNNELTATEDIEKTAYEIMNGSYGFIIPKRSIFFVPTTLIEKTLAERFPRFDEVAVSRSGPTSLTISVHERRADMVWCVETASQASSTASSSFKSDCYFLDPTGLVIAHAPYFTSGIFFEIYSEPLAEPLGKQPLDQASLGNIHELARILPEALRALPNSPYYPDSIHVKGDEYVVNVASRSVAYAPWELRLNSRQPAVDTMTNLRSVLSADAFKEDYAKYKGAIAYVDLRFGKKVFYKFRE